LSPANFDLKSLEDNTSILLSLFSCAVISPQLGTAKIAITDSDKIMFFIFLFKA
jgi:hypothetical protein